MNTMQGRILWFYDLNINFEDNNMYSFLKNNNNKNKLTHLFMLIINKCYEIYGCPLSC